MSQPRKNKIYDPKYKIFFQTFCDTATGFSQPAKCPSCNATFFSKQRGYEHVQKSHPEDVHQPSQNSQSSSQLKNFHEFENSQIEELHIEQATTNTSFTFQEEHLSVIDRVNDDNFFKKFMQLLSDLKFNKNIPSSTVNFIGTSIIDLCQEYSQLRPNDSLIDTYKQISHSDYLQNKYLHRQLRSTLVNAQNHTHLIDNDGNSYPFKYSTVSIESLMRKTLNNKFILEKIIKERTTSQHHSTTITNLEHCSIWPRLKGRLKLELYLDDAQIAPSGIFNKNQKYFFLYATFPDIPYAQRVAENDIDILLMANRNKLTELKRQQNLIDPIGTLLRGVCEELKLLTETGIEIPYQGSQVNIKLALSCICGDNAGIYELLGLKVCFNNNAFVCRFCGMRGKSKDDSEFDIQNTEFNFSLIEEPSVQVLDTLDVQRAFIFEEISHIHRFNCCPLDPLHDLGEGTIPNILKFIFYYWANYREEHLSAETIVNKINSFNFYEGCPFISTTTKKFPDKQTYHLFKIEASGLQNFEILLKLEAIFFNELENSFDWPEFQLFRNLKLFTLLVFKLEFTIEDINQLKTLSHLILQSCQQLRVKILADESEQVYCKLHQLIHYSECVKKFGPPYLYCTSRFERKHQTIKNIARQMGCWINPTKTAHRKQQLKRALSDAKLSIENQNFYAFSEEQLYSTSLPSNCKKLTTSKYPYRLDMKMKIIRRLASSRNLWFKTEEFYQKDSGEIICKGEVLKLWFKPNEINQFVFKLHNNSLNAMTATKKCVYIPLSNLHFANDFLFTHISDPSDVAGWLFKWFFSV